VIAAAIAFFLLVAVGREARAQSCSNPNGATGIASGGVIRVPATPGGNIPAHPGNIGPNIINFADCEADVALQIPVTIAGQSPNTIQVWAGAQDCGALAARSATTATCWQVAAPVVAAANPTILNVKVRDIVSQISTTPKNVNPYSGEAPESVCRTAQTSSGAVPITLYIFVADSASNVCGNEVQYGTTVAMLAPAINGTISSGVGDTVLFINVPPASDSSTKQWNVYCDPPPNGQSAPPEDASATTGTTTTVSNPQCLDSGATSTPSGADASGDDASGDDSGSVVDATIPISTPDASSCGAPVIDAGAAGSNTNQCTSTVVVPGGGTTTSNGDGGSVTTGGTQTIIPGAYQCATADVTTTTIQVGNLSNGTKYTIGVAAVDQYGNVGPVSNVLCDQSTTPEPVNDFWQVYKSDGGQAGGGFCALEAVGAPGGSAAVFGGGLVAAIGAIVARRRRRS
jgi:hypothetical protein